MASLTLRAMHAERVPSLTLRVGFGGGDLCDGGGVLNVRFPDGLLLMLLPVVVFSRHVSCSSLSGMLSSDNDIFAASKTLARLFSWRCFSYFFIACFFEKAEVAKQLGTNVDTEDVGMVSARKEFDEKKKALADAFARKARALAEIEDILGEPQARTFLFEEPSSSSTCTYEALVRILPPRLTSFYWVTGYSVAGDDN